MLMCIQNLVKFCPFILKILSGNENYDGITELQNNRMTEGQTGQIQYSPHFFKAGLIQNLVKFCPFILKILSGNENYDGITELQNDRMTEGQTGQIQYSPHFFKAGYNNIFI